MDTNLENTIKEEIAKLPKEATEVINKFNWIKISEEIGKKYELNEEKIEKLQVETSLVLLNLIEENEYLENLQKNIELDSEKTKKIIEEINEKIFIPISNQITENIKKDFKYRKTNWEQNINFILSGGDYIFFLSPSTSRPDKGDLEGFSDKRETGGLKEYNPSNLPLSGEAIQKNLEDIKRKFTI